MDLLKSILKVSEVECERYIFSSFRNKVLERHFVHGFLRFRQELNSKVIQSMFYLSY